MEVEIILRETIKPSSPTPLHLKTFKISIIDRIYPKCYVPFITYYAIKDSTKFSVERIKHALAETLTRFYPLAGRPNFKDYTVDCNDNGILFLTAHVNCQLSDVLKGPIIEELYKFVTPLPPVCPDEDGMAQLGIQFNVFKCGGVAISVCFFHYICDGATISAVMKCWSELSCLSRNESDVFYPSFPAADLFPQGDEPIPEDSSFMMERLLIKEGEGVMRRFMFDKRAINALREKARSDCVPYPTRVEVVSMFTWKHCLLATEKVCGNRRSSFLNTIVNLRQHMMSPFLSEYSVGNIFWKSMIRCGTSDKIDIKKLVSSLRAAMDEDRQKLILKLKNNEGRNMILEYIDALKEICRDNDLNPYNITSWCRMGFIDVDFGWGKPVWVSQVGSNNIRSVYKNTMAFLDGDQESIELWLILDRREMIALENDLEFLAFASPNPSISV